jgi:hypothetical protein
MHAIVLFLAFFSINAQAMSCSPGSENDPDIHQRIATDKYSPFPAMYFASFGGDLLSAVVFRQRSGTADFGNADMKRVTDAAIWTWSTSLLLAAVTQGCTVSKNVEEKVGPVARTEVDRERLKTQRKMFYFIHALNMLPTLGFAVYSKRDDRWAWFGGLLVLPAVTDLVSRYVFQSNDVSPWTLTAAFHKDGERRITPMLAWQLSW